MTKAQSEVPKLPEVNPVAQIASEAVDTRNPQPESSTEKNLRPREWLVAVIGLAGALIGGGATFAGVLYQSNAASNAQTTSERRTLYVNYYTALENMIEYATGTMVYLESGSPKSMWGSEDSQYRAYAKQYGNLRVQIVLLGSPDAAKIVQAEERYTTQMNSSLNVLEARIQYPNLPVTIVTPTKKAAITELSDDIHHCQSEADQFVTYARFELG
jgi:hypothetical protein